MAFNQLKKWVGTQLWSTFMTEYNDNVDELNRVIDGVNENVDATNAHMAESAGKHIYSSGSNQYGRFVKYDDGTMICYGEIPQINDIAFTAYGNGWRSDTFTHFLPAIFLEGTVATAKVNQNTLGYYGMSVSERVQNLDRIQFRFESIIGTADGKDSTPLTYMAVGRWK